MIHRPRRPAGGVIPRCELLEGREVPARLVGIGADGASLVTFDSAAPTAVTTTTVTGLAGEIIVGLDYRPADGKLYAVSDFNRLFVIDAAGAATQVGADFATALDGTAFGVDFNPVANKLRIVSNTGQNLRLTVDTAGNTVTVATDTALDYDDAAFNAGNEAPEAVPAPTIVATAYTRNPNDAGNGFVTTQYVIDGALDFLSTQGGPEGTPSPNGGVLFRVPGGDLGFDADETTSFEIVAGTDSAFATKRVAAGTELYSVNLATGDTVLLGVVPAQLAGLASAPPEAGAGTIQLAANAATFPTTRTPIAVTVTRTGGSTGAVTVAYATADGTGTNAARANVDYLPVGGTVTFAEGQTEATIFLALPATVVPGAAKTFSLTLSAPGGGAALGTTTSATITIPAVANVAPAGNLAGPNPALVDAPTVQTPADPAVTPPPTPNRFVAAGAGVGGGPVVNVYDALTGTPLYNFNAFEESFRGGVTVATGDVNGDGVDDIIVGTGFGGGPRVFIFDGQTKATIANFFAYEETFRGGVNVAVGDINGDGFGDILVGSGVGGGPRVRAFSGVGLSPTGAPTILADFFAYEESFRGGVNVASGQFGTDNFDTIIAGSGVGGGPRVRLFTLSGTAIANGADFSVGDDALRVGVNVSAGDVTGDGITDIVTGFGSGPDTVGVFGPTGTKLASFAAFGGQANGVRVATNDFLADGTTEILAGSGSGGTSQVRVYQLVTATPAGGGTPSLTATQITGIQAYPEGFTGGVYVG